MKDGYAISGCFRAWLEFDELTPRIHPFWGWGLWGAGGPAHVRLSVSPLQKMALNHRPLPGGHITGVFSFSGVVFWKMNLLQIFINQQIAMKAEYLWEGSFWL